MNLFSFARFVADIGRSNRGTLPLPYRYFIVVTKSCASRCKHCHIWREAPHNELTLSEHERLAAGSPQLKWLNLSGGEPTDREDLPAIVAAYHRSCPDLLMANFTTNGLYPEHIERQVSQIARLRIPLLAINVSIDGPPEVNDRLRGIEGDFDAAVDTFARLRRIRGVSSKVAYTLYPANRLLIGATVAEIARRVPGFSARDLHLNVPHQSSHFYGNQDMRPSPMADLHQVLADHSRGFAWPHPQTMVERIYRRLARRYVADAKTPLPCAAVMSSVYISEHGAVYPCTIWDKPIGSLRDSDFDLGVILASARARDTREQARTGACPQCWTPCEAFPTILANLTRAVT